MEMQNTVSEVSVVEHPIYRRHKVGFSSFEARAKKIWGKKTKPEKRSFVVKPRGKSLPPVEWMRRRLSYRSFCLQV
ncbi:hypothetical protein SLA2020_127260 [Shorea laevis]